MIAGKPPTPGAQSQLCKDADTSPVPRRTSAKQIEANRENALHSTGPTTPEGKEASRRNALKDGLRAKQVIIPGLENPAEFEELLRELCDDWEPAGHTEIHMVEEIAMAEWRLRRVRRAELGEIRKQMPTPTLSKSEAEANILQTLYDSPESVPQILGRSSAGIPHLRQAVEVALAEVKSEGIISKETCEYLDSVFGENPNSPVATVTAIFRNWKERNAEEENSDGEPTPRADKSELYAKAVALTKIVARKLLKQALKHLDRQERKLHKKERTELEIDRQRLSIPEGLELERFQRYETAIKRDMYRAIDQLERLQRRRRGEPPPPTVNVKVSNDD